VRYEGVYKLFGDHPVVEDLNLHVADGEFLVLVGPSGCGKTTSLRMLAGFDRPTYGRIWIDDAVVNSVPPKARDIAMVFQSYALFPHMTVRQNLAFGTKVRREPRREAILRVAEVADLLGLTTLLDRKPAALSGGQRQRVALGRALMRRPKVFLMDEPLSNLDAALRVQMRTELEQLHKRFGITTLYVTHDQVEAMTMGDRIAIMSDGRLQQIDTPEALYDNPATLFAATFIGSPKMNVVQARLTTDRDDSVFVECLGVRLPVDRTRLLPGTRADVLLGIRPEDIAWKAISDGSGVCVAAEVDLVEPMGHEAHVRVLVGATPLVTRFPPRSGVRSHDQVELMLDVNRIHLFDPTTEACLLAAASGRAGALDRAGAVGRRATEPTRGREGWPRETIEPGRSPVERIASVRRTNDN
jgi:multiple sugar transport system ATP-binding protein